MTKTQANIHFDADRNQYQCTGEWNVYHLAELKKKLHHLPPPETKEAGIDGAAITTMDSAGAWLLLSWQQKHDLKLQSFPPPQQALLKLVANAIKQKQTIPKQEKPHFVTRIGIMAVEQWQELIDYLQFMGKLSLQFLYMIVNPRLFRLNEIAGIIYKTGYSALPIIALLSFMIGVVIAYQMGLQLRNYGANVYIVDLLGLSILREFGPLLTAIMVAGRTGSAFTAQLGIMKINQEIDALDTMGIPPGQLLLWPRVIGLVIALPLLAIWADIFGILGGMVMSNNMLHITFYDFLHRFPTVIKLKNLFIGLGKAPVFAFIIATIGCFQGMQVSGSADSLGRNTTRSVVLAIFFIILADAGFSVLFSKLKL